AWQLQRFSRQLMRLVEVPGKGEAVRALQQRGEVPLEIERRPSGRARQRAVAVRARRLSEVGPRQRGGALQACSRDRFFSVSSSEVPSARQLSPVQRRPDLRRGYAKSVGQLARRLELPRHLRFVVPEERLDVQRRTKRDGIE